MRTVKVCSVALLACTAGCASPYLRQPLFVVEAADAEIPVMVCPERGVA